MSELHDFINPHRYPWWKCEFPACNKVFNAEMSVACHHCGVRLSDMPELHSYRLQNVIDDDEKDTSMIVDDEDSTDHPRSPPNKFIASVDGYRKANNKSRLKSNKHLKSSKHSSNLLSSNKGTEPYRIPCRIGATAEEESMAHGKTSADQKSYEFIFLPITLSGCAEEGLPLQNRDIPEVWENNMTNVRMKNGVGWFKGDKGWEKWLFDTFVAPNSPHKIFASLQPVPVLESYQLAVFDPFKSGQRPKYYLLQPPSAEDRRLYRNVADWLESWLKPKPGTKITPFGFAIIGRRPSATDVSSNGKLPTQDSIQHKLPEPTPTFPTPSHDLQHRLISKPWQIVRFTLDDISSWQFPSLPKFFETGDEVFLQDAMEVKGMGTLWIMAHCINNGLSFLVPSPDPESRKGFGISGICQALMAHIMEQFATVVGECQETTVVSECQETRANELSRYKTVLSQCYFPLPALLACEKNPTDSSSVIANCFTFPTVHLGKLIANNTVEYGFENIFTSIHLAWCAIQADLQVLAEVSNDIEVARLRWKHLTDAIAHYVLIRTNFRVIAFLDKMRWEDFRNGKFPGTVEVYCLLELNSAGAKAANKGVIDRIRLFLRHHQCSANPVCSALVFSGRYDKAWLPEFLELHVGTNFAEDWGVENH